ncbi:hypothetical protein HU200_055197 [Digitaria exilis]|uniref:Hcy-binding domain-containing protein n=1 Tax=Digitaria exilis TaxID=1010633 RepID=A0A835AG71_9POAL|nr:hypothetical protein HU200_055197 [Digitaria exilis]
MGGTRPCLVNMKHVSFCSVFCLLRINDSAKASRVVVAEDTTGASGTDFAACVGEWRRAGAALIGGCCRTTPATVRAIARALREDDADEYDDVPAVAVL